MSATAAAKKLNKRRGSGNIVIRELEERFKGRQGARVSPVNDDSQLAPLGGNEEEKRDSKRIIHENLLQARAKWEAQNREKEGAGDDESPRDENKKDFVQSLEGTSRFCIDANDKPDSPDAVVLRSKRAYSNSYLNQRVIPAPPKTRPPVIAHDEKTGGPTSGQKSVPQSGGKGKQGSGGGGGGLKGAAVKIFGKFGKGKNAKQSNAAAGTKSSNAAKKKIGIKKALSENILVTRGISNSTNSTDDDGNALQPISKPYKDYQNVFNDPNFNPHRQQQQSQQLDGNRSGTNSPTDCRKPKPLPRRNMRNSTGDPESDTETLSPFSPRVPSPLQTSNSNMVDSDSSTPLALSPRPPSGSKSPVSKKASSSSLHVLMSREDELVSSVSSDGSTRQAVVKAASLNPQGVVGEWGAVATRKSTRQKKLARRAIFSEGDQEDLDDDYITMNSVGGSFVDRGNIRSMGILQAPDVSITGTEGELSEALGGLVIPILSTPKEAGQQSPSLPYTGLAPTSNLAHDYQGLSIPSDNKRLSSYYMKIISGEAGSSPLHSRPALAESSENDAEESDEDLGLYIEVGKEERGKNKLPPVLRKLRKENTVPLLKTEDREDEGDPVMMSVPIHGFNTRTANSATPPQQAPPTTTLTPPSVEKSVKGRKFQYTEVTVEPSTKKRVPSLDKKLKYQTVTLSRETGQCTIADSPDIPRNESPAALKQIKQADQSEDSDSDVDFEFPFFPKGSHPLLKPSNPAPAASGGTVDQRSYYINRQSLIALESCKDLPSTMLSTVDPVTGKVLWHEYVEIDEDQLDNMATSVGVTKSTPIPEKLGMLLSAQSASNKKDKTLASEASASPDITIKSTSKAHFTIASDKPEAVVTPKPQMDRLSLTHSLSEDSLSDDNTGQSLNSSQSSECNYIFNLDAPPSIPPRPDNLDALVDQLQLKDRSSGDYSYAAIPEKHLFGKHWMRFKTKNVTKPTTLSIPKENASSPQQKPSASPPVIPPKSRSLLREQELRISDLKESSPEPYLLPVIVKTKKQKKTQKQQLKEKNQSTFISYIMDRISPTRQMNSKDRDEARMKRFTSPPKPIPYEEHQKKKKLQSTSSDENGGVRMHVGSATVGARRPIPQRAAGVGHKTHGKLQHKKLARQSYRGSHKISSHQARQRMTSPNEGSSRVQQGGVQKRRKPRGPRAAMTEQLKGESLTTLMRNPALAERISTIVTNDESDPKQDGSSGDDQDARLRKQLTTSRGLSEIFVEISRLLKDSHCSEDDLLSAIESHFNLKVNKSSKSQETPIEESSKQEASSPVKEKESGLKSSEKKLEPSKDAKPPYVNLFFGESDGEEDQVGKLELPPSKSPETQSKAQNRPYVNLEFPESENESSQDDYIQPGEAFASRDPSKPDLSTSPTKYFNPSNIPKICVDEETRDVCPLRQQKHIVRSGSSAAVPSERASKVVKTPAPTPRVRSKSSIIRSSDQQCLDSAVQNRHERTLSNPSESPPESSEKLEADTCESNLDFAPSVSKRIPEQFQKPRNTPIRTGQSQGADAPSVSEEKTSSYNLALEMEERRFTNSVNVSATRKVRQAGVRDEEGEDSAHGRKKREGVARKYVHFTDI